MAPFTKHINDNLTQREVDYFPIQIKKMTPYLDEILCPNNNPKLSKKKLSLKHRCFAWYYVFNQNNKSDAYKRIKYGKFNPETSEIEIIIPQSEKSIPYWNTKCAINADSIFSLHYVQSAINLIRERHCNALLFDTKQTYIEQLKIRATYDISFFLTPKGEMKIKTWEEVPEKYRCVIDGIEEKRYGKDGDQCTVVLKLADREKAMKELAKLLPSDQLDIVEKLRIEHTGQLKAEKWKDRDPGQMTDEELKLAMDEMEGK